jgi:hypothetical protein
MAARRPKRITAPARIDAPDNPTGNAGFKNLPEDHNPVRRECAQRILRQLDRGGDAWL